MPDYGHEAMFGSFLTPAAERPEQVVELAALSEAVGLDVVTFQDHPYQAAFLDTWTLLSFVAARTSSITIAANVTNLPLRPPAVLARSVASLDRLSHGRVELGLGAGAFWDAMVAMGARRLSANQSVQALEEAVEVIRQIWDTEARGGVRVDGEFHQVLGAKRGPAPAHRIGIWLGAYKPRMLAVTGQRADGWLPSLSYLQPGDLAKGNAVIDDAAEQAGRTPSDIRRLLNISGEFRAAGRGPLVGPPEQWAEELADLALTEGVSVFILGSDDPDDLRRFAAEVAPAVRELVADERAGQRSSAPTAGPATSPHLAAAGSGFAVVPTPDDGTRRSAEAAWDESTRPSGPPRDPRRLYTTHEQTSGQHLVDVHNALRGELAQLHDLIDQVAAGDLDAGRARSHISTMTMRQNKWTLGTYCESYCRIVTTHHTIEDRNLFPALRRADERLAPVVDRLEQEHHVIHDLLEQVDGALVRFVSVPDGLPQLRAAVDLLSDALLSHLSYEERELVEPIARIGVL